MYYLKYNGIDLTDMVKVRSVEIPSLPEMSHSQIEVFERDGGIYNGMSYGAREINIKFIVYPENPEDYDIYINDVKRTFYVKSECPLYCGDEDKYIMCVPDGDLIITELGDYCSEVEVNLISYQPYWVSKDITLVDSETKDFTVENNGDAPTYPIIDIGISQNTSFIQIENLTNRGAILLGGRPSAENTTTEKSSTYVLNDVMESTSGWVSSSATIDGNKATGGTIAVTANGQGLMAGDFGSASSGAVWHGPAYRKNLGTSLKDFTVKIRMSHNSSGTNGDPYVQKPYSNDTGTPSSGSKKAYYVCNVAALNVRSGPSTSHKKLGSIKKGHKITSYTISKNWIKFTFNGKTGYVYAPYCKKVTGTTEVTSNQCNFVTTLPTAIRVSPSKSAKNQKTIPVGTCIRCITSTKYPTTGKDNVKGKFYKLAKKWNGYTGYVYIDNLVKASEYEVVYDEDMFETADDKTGVASLYGYSSDGTQLFSLSMIDDNEYYEFSYPLIRKNNTDFLKDKTVAPAPKTKTEYSTSNDELTANKSYKLSGKYGDWNEFYGELYIERIANKWYAYVQRIKDGVITKEIKSKTVTDTKNSDKSLSYIVIYFGTTGTAEKATGMAISDIKIKNPSKNSAYAENTGAPPTVNWQEFEAGDDIIIDCSIPTVFLNNVEVPELIDVGSEFFALEPGENDIKISSDDTGPVTSIVFNEKYL